MSGRRSSSSSRTTRRRQGKKALIREATQKYIQEAGGVKVIEIRGGITVKEAKGEIVAYLRRHKEAETFDIANDLRLDLGLTVRALKELWEEGKVA